MRIITQNLNGIRSAVNKGFIEWMRRQKPDVVCLQEVRAHESQIPPRALNPRNYHAYFNLAERKGYSGVGLYSKAKPDRVITKLGWSEFDDEGRYIQADFGDLSVVSIYMPSGSSGDHRQAVKYEVMDFLMKRFRKLAKDGRRYIFCGDWNICHRNIDIKNWRGNQKNSGFLPEERAWLDVLYDKVGYLDAFRVINQEPDQYTWWSNRGQAWANNVGWRLDYHVISPQLRSQIRAASIYKRKRFSDHAPLTIDYALTIDAEDHPV